MRLVKRATRSITLGATLVAALAVGSREATADRARDAERFLEEWDVPAAEQLVDGLLAAAPDAAETQYLLGRLRFQQGRYGEALQQLQAAIAQESNPEWHAYEALARSVDEATRGFTSRTSRNGHFEVYFQPGRDEMLVEYLGDALEAQRSALEVDFGFAPAERVRVEIFPAITDLARVSTLTAEEIETSGVIALCKWNRLMIVSPRALLRGYPWMDAAAHEYVHYVVSRMTRDRVPVWLHEGIAKFKEERWRRVDDGRATLPPAVEELLAQAVRENELVPLEKLHPSIAKLPSQKHASIAFAEVATLIEYVAQRAGKTALRMVLQHVRDGKEADRALADAVGVTFGQLQRAWKESLRSRARVRRHVPAIALSFRKGDEKASDPDPTRVGDDKVRRFARLGTLLEERGRPRAATMEYEKALGQARAPVPLISLRLGRLYLDLDDPAKALEAAKSAGESYPELAGPHVTSGQALVRLGRVPEAVAELQAALRVSPFDPRVHCGLGEAYAKIGDARMAKEKQLCASLD